MDWSFQLGALITIDLTSKLCYKASRKVIKIIRGGPLLVLLLNETDFGKES